MLRTRRPIGRRRNGTGGGGYHGHVSQMTICDVRTVDTDVVFAQHCHCHGSSPENNAFVKFAVRATTFVLHNGFFLSVQFATGATSEWSVRIYQTHVAYISPICLHFYSHVVYHHLYTNLLATCPYLTGARYHTRTSVIVPWNINLSKSDVTEVFCTAPHDDTSTPMWSERHRSGTDLDCCRHALTSPGEILPSSVPSRDVFP